MRALIMALLLISCSSIKAEAAPRCVAAYYSEHNTLGLQQHYKLRRGESLCSAKGRELFTFRRVLSDRRCPANARCQKSVLANSVDILVEVVQSNGRRSRVVSTLGRRIGKAGGIRTVKIGAANYTFEGVTPYPGTGDRSATRAYFTTDSAPRTIASTCNYDACIAVVACGRMPNGEWRYFPIHAPLDVLEQ